jgi:error-prone DNA polymerase
MSPDGDNVLARWREIGEWWSHEDPREYRRFIDTLNVIREAGQEFHYGGDGQCQSKLSHKLRVRDEKVAKAMGNAPEPTYSDYQSGQKREPLALLHTLSGYSYGRSTMHAADILTYPEAQGYEAVLLADVFSLTGAVEFDKVASEMGCQALIGSTFEMEDGGEIILVAKTKCGYQNLSQLISICHAEEPRLFPLCTWERLSRFPHDLICLTGGDAGPINRLVTRGDINGAQRMLQQLIDLYGEVNVFVQIERCYLPWEMRTNRHLLDLARAMKVTAVAGNGTTHHRPQHFPAQDTIVCIETLCAIEDVVGRKPRRSPEQPEVQQRPMRALNAERFLRSTAEMKELFTDCPELLTNTMKIAEACENSVLPPRTQLPPYCDDEVELLHNIVYARASDLPEKCKNVRGTRTARLNREMDRIIKNGFAGHFLVAWDMCRWATEQNIVFSGRGSVVDSAVAYCLGLSRIDGFEHDLHFDRFLPDDGSKRPDIDIDFEARRRDDIRTYLSTKYGYDRVATVGAIGTYNTRGIVREVGKVLGIPQEDLDYLAKRLHGSVSPDRIERALDSKPELKNSHIPRERFRWVFRLARDLMDIPRNLRSHSSGVIISSQPICYTVPVLPSAVPNVQIIQWDKRSTKYFFDKFDILCLRGNDVLSDAQERVRLQSPDFSVTNLPLDDEDVYRTMRAGELIGIPQSASPAMRQAHVRIQTRDLKDASLVQAGIRPGVGGAVKLNELILRKKGKPFTYSHWLLEEILKDTYGLIVFQEQVDLLLQRFGNFTCGEAEQIREDIYKKRKLEHVAKIRDEVIAKFVSSGHTQEVAEEVYGLVSQFQGYGFAEGHALAFAEISVRSIYCQQNYPTEYFAALLDAQPAGYYGPRTLVNEARCRGVTILPPNVNISNLKYGVEDVVAEDDPQIKIPNNGIRISLKEIRDVSKASLERIVASRPYSSFFDFVARVRPHRDELEKLILCGALDSLHDNRRAMLWAIPRALRFAANVECDLPLRVQEPELPMNIQDFNEFERAIQDRRGLGLDIKQHLMAFERTRVKDKGALTAAEASRLPSGTKAIVVGNPIRLRFPPTESGKRVLFFDLEDETGLLNVTCFDATYLRDGHHVICNPYVTLRGEAQDRDGHTAFLVHRIFPYQADLEKQLRQNETMPVKSADFLFN